MSRCNVIRLRTTPLSTRSLYLRIFISRSLTEAQEGPAVLVIKAPKMAAGELELGVRPIPRMGINVAAIRRGAGEASPPSRLNRRKPLRR